MSEVRVRSVLYYGDDYTNHRPKILVDSFQTRFVLLHDQKNIRSIMPVTYIDVLNQFVH